MKIIFKRKDSKNAVHTTAALSLFYTSTFIKVFFELVGGKKTVVEVTKHT